MKKINMRLGSTNLLQLFQLRRSLLIWKMLYMRLLKKNSGKYKKRFWVRKIYFERKQRVELKMPVKDLQLNDGLFFFEYFLMSHTVFEELLTWIALFVQKQETKMGGPISPRERLWPLAIHR